MRAKRHFCESRGKPGAGVVHTRGDCAPRRRACESCGGRLIVETGYYGVFERNAEGRYPAENAIATFRSRRAAQKWINYRDLVIQWIPTEG